MFDNKAKAQFLIDCTQNTDKIYNEMIYKIAISDPYILWFYPPPPFLNDHNNPIFWDCLKNVLGMNM